MLDSKKAKEWTVHAYVYAEIYVEHYVRLDNRQSINSKFQVRIKMSWDRKENKIE